MAPDEVTAVAAGDITDRRVLRGIRNRDAVVDALLELLRLGELSPTVGQIADRAGVSLRSVYHHFDDLEGLFGAVADLHVATIVDKLRAVDSSGPLAPRIKRFAAQRAALAERVLPVYRASLLIRSTSPTVHHRIQRGNDYLRHEALATFRPELGRTTGWRVEAIDSAASLDGWTRLRIIQDLTIPRSTRVVAQTLGAVLGSGDG